MKIGQRLILDVDSLGPLLKKQNISETFLKLKLLLHLEGTCWILYLTIQEVLAFKKKSMKLICAQ